MSKTTKRLISQRWDNTFVEEVRQVALQLKITSTDLTIESLEFMISLIKNQPKIMTDSNSRASYLQKLVEGNFAAVKKKRISKSLKRDSGFVMDSLIYYLKTNSNQTFSTTELSTELNIPQPTVRTYIRKLAEKDPNFRLIRGRPNHIGYYG